jgi:hypothetical protein
VRAAIYARVSTTDQKCEMQLAELREYVSRRGWELAGEYVDTGWTGANTNRPQFKRLDGGCSPAEGGCNSLLEAGSIWTFSTALHECTTGTPGLMVFASSLPARTLIPMNRIHLRTVSATRAYGGC